MKRNILIAITLLMAFSAALAAEVGAPPTPLGWPFAAVAKDMKLHNATSINGKTIGTVPTDTELSFRESEIYEHWIYIDDNEQNVHGWCLDYGGYYGDKSNRDPDESAYQDALDYAYITLGHNPEAFKRESSEDLICDNEETADEAAVQTVDGDYDKALDKAVNNKKAKHYSS